MKKGIILYVIGKEPDGWEATPQKVQTELALKADALEVITRKTGHFDIADAWRTLLTKGMAQITCRMAQFTPSGQLELMARDMRLCG